MNIRLDQKRALVTGGSSGIGAAIARRDEKSGGDSARQGRAHPHPCAHRRSIAHNTGPRARAQTEIQADLCGRPCQSCALNEELAPVVMRMGSHSGKLS